MKEHICAVCHEDVPSVMAPPYRVCLACFEALECFDFNPNMMRKAADYIESHREKN